MLTTILRTLQRNGLALGGLSAAGTARDQLLKLLDTSSPDPQ